MPDDRPLDEKIVQARDALVADLLRSDGADDAALLERLRRFADLFLEDAPEPVEIVGRESAG